MGYRLWAILLVAVILGGCVSSEPVPFDETRWKTHRSLGMAYDIEEGDIVHGRTYRQVLQILGEPTLQSDDPEQEPSGGMSYRLERGWELFLGLENGVVTHAKVLEP